MVLIEHIGLIIKWDQMQQLGTIKVTKETSLGARIDRKNVGTLPVTGVSQCFDFLHIFATSA